MGIVMHLFRKNNIVTISEEDICLSEDMELLKSLIGNKLTVVDVKHIDNDLTHYTCKDENNSIIMYDKEIPFAFIDADLKYYKEGKL